MKYRAEAAFLPAALEIQETPPSPLGRAVIFAILAFFVSALGWASLGDVDTVAVARGRIIPSGHSKIVQTPEKGAVSSIRVQEGQVVRAGDVLIELDNTSARADVDRLRREGESLGREIERHRQLAAWLNAGDPPSRSELKANSDALMVRQWQEHQDRLRVLDRQRGQKVAERRSLQDQVEKLGAVLPIVTKRAANLGKLFDQKLASERQFLEAEQQRLETLHDLRSHTGRVAEIDAALSTLDARVQSARSEYLREILEQLELSRRRKDAVEQELIKAHSRAAAHTIRAPVDGSVQQLTTRNVGAVVTPAQALMTIVPRGDTLEVEAVLENKDIGFVEVGQTAEVKIDTFPFTKYGTIGGSVVAISEDAVADEQKGLVYKMRVVMERSAIDVNGKIAALGPGMSVSVESKTGKRRLIEFFLSPLLRFKSESLRER